jgi:hypothetical protein
MGGKTLTRVAIATGTVLGALSAMGGAATAASPAPQIQHLVVINLENESFNASFGRGSVATYLNSTLVPAGVLVTHYFGTAHLSLPNYIAQISGQAPAPDTQTDCGGTYAAMTPGRDTGTVGQVRVKRGCVYPASVPTIAAQLDAASAPDPVTHRASWRAYMEDMGVDATRDGGTSCAHPALGSPNTTNFASSRDGYAARHNGFVWFRSVVDASAECKANVVGLGRWTRRGGFTGPLADDLSSEGTTPAFATISPSLCNDGHDETCASPSAAGGSVGGLRAADAWLRRWMPLLLSSPAYQSGSMAIVVTFDEAEIGGPGSGAACCSEQSGPNVTSAGFGFGPGGGKVGALILAGDHVPVGTKDTVGHYNHYSLLRTAEDLLGITTGGSDGLGHLGMAGAPGVASFGTDVFPPTN